MADWWSYRIEDLVMFSPRTYWRLFELQNRALWPLPLAALATGIALPAVLWLRSPVLDRAAWTVLAAAWAWVGWSFLLGRYAAINLAVAYAAPLFFAESLLLLWWGVVRLRLGRARIGTRSAAIGMALCVYAVLLHPLIAPLSGRPALAAEVFAIAPDPTAVATLGLLAALPRSGRAAALLALPALWCAFSAATLAGLGAWQGWVPAGAVVLTLLAVGRRG